MSNIPLKDNRSSSVEMSKIPPSDLQAEQAVLGAILLDANAITKSFDYIDVNSFY